MIAFLERLFPPAAKAHDLPDFIVALCVYLLMAFAAAVTAVTVCLLFPAHLLLVVIGGALLGLYAVCGFLFCVLRYFGVL